MGDAPLPQVGRPRRASDDAVAGLIAPALRTGAACGGIGFLFGGTAGILKNTTPFLFASAAGLQCFALGTSFWGVRSSILQLWTPEQHMPANLTAASTVSGAMTGGLVALATRGRSNAVPGAVMFALFGCLGQTAVNAFVNRSENRPVDSRQGFWKRLGDKKWMPFTVMTDDEYVDLLKERLFKIDVEIAVVDDKITALRKAQQQSPQDQPSEGVLQQ